MNTIGTLLRFTSFGESHGPVIGGVIDGFPAGHTVDFAYIRLWLDRRRTGNISTASARRETDEPVFLSGIFEGKTTGTPIAFIIPNEDARSKDYDALRDTFRPCHADYTYTAKYGIRDHRGGGRASARETAARVVAGALAAQYLADKGIAISSSVLKPSPEALETAARSADTIGALIECSIAGIPAGIGEPVFGKLQALLAAAMMSINAAKGFEYGDGFAAADAYGSSSLDTPYVGNDGEIHTRTNHSGGIQGGISNGGTITFRVAFKPIATLPRSVETIDKDGNAVTLTAGGRHDICVAPRVAVVVEAMAALTILDAMLIANASTL